MVKPRVLVVEHHLNAGAGLVGGRLRARGLDLHTVGPEAGAAVPENLAGYDALVVMGGSMGPTDDEVAPWLPRTRALLAEAVESDVPTLGICLGAQLLATATGGRVAEMPAGPEVGLCEVQIAAAAAPDPLFGALAGSTVAAVQWHWLEAETLPEDAAVLASSGACQNQVFRIGGRAWGVQFHPEALAATAQAWAEEDRGSLAQLGLAEGTLVQEVRDAEPDLTGLWGAMSDRFAEIVIGGSLLPS